MQESVSSETESRKHSRVSSRLRCWCEGENVTVYARVGNLSEGGLFLRTSTPMPKGAKAVVRLRDPNTEEISAPVRVVWTREAQGTHPAGMGLEFGDIDDQARAVIRRIIQSERHASRD